MYNFNWITPSDELLPNPPQNSPCKIYTGDSIEDFITSIGYNCECVKITTGATVSSYHFDLHNIRHVKKVNADIVPMLKAELKCSVISNKSDIAHFALEIPNQARSDVYLKSAMMTHEFMNTSGIPACLGTDVEGKALAVDISSLPHMIVSGTTGSGKSVLINSIITSIIFRLPPSACQFVLIDPKKSEFFQFANIPHLFNTVITDTNEAIHMLSEMVRIMEERSTLLESMGKRDITGTDIIPIIIVIDELADLMDTSKGEVEEYITRLAQRGRSCGLHLIIATQSPRSSVLTPLVRSNILTKVALRCTTDIDSRISLGRNGARDLLGRGDGIIQGLPGDIREYRFQAAWISPEDIQRVVWWWNSPHCWSPVVGQ